MPIIYSNRDINMENYKDYSFEYSSNNIYNKLSPKITWPYSKAKEIWNLLFCSWQIWIDPQTMNLVKWWIEEETKRSIRNLAGVLKEYRLSLKNVIKTVIYLKDIKDIHIVDKIYKNYFILKPARSIIEVNNLDKNALIEIELIAEIKKD